jgi:hypothetical protein
MATVAGICNLALARIGVKDFIDDIGEATAEAQASSVVYSLARDSCLASYPWSFATRRATLAVPATVTRTGWEYVYTLPADCLVPRSLWVGTNTPLPAVRAEWTLEQNDAGDGLLLVANTADAELTYTAKVTDTNLYPPLFTNALAWLIASELAVPLAARTDLREQALKMAEAVLQLAAAQAFSEGHAWVPESELITIRG